VSTTTQLHTHSTYISYLLKAIHKWQILVTRAWC